MIDLRTTAQQALEAIEQCRMDGNYRSFQQESDAIQALRAALAAPQPEPVAWTARELELIDGMIEVQLRHAERCDSIGNRTMAEKQKGWDMERVALLQKIRSTTPPATEALIDQMLEALESLFSGNDDPERGKRCADAIAKARKHKGLS